MTLPINTFEPDNVITGTSLKWTKTLSNYPASDGWILKYYMVGPSGKIEITASTSGDDFSVSVLPADTENYEPGIYQWVSFVEKLTAGVVTERYAIESGSLEVIQDPSTFATGVDNRSHAQRVLQSINTLLEGKALSAEQSYSIAGRSISLMSIRDLLLWKDYYELAVKTELDAEKVLKGEPTGRKVLTRFGQSWFDLWWRVLP